MSSKSKEKEKEAAEEKNECVKVVMRCRPLSSTEKKNGNQKIVTMDFSRKAVMVYPPNDQPIGNNNDPSNSNQQALGAPKTFTFDAVFDESCTQSQVYDECARPIVDSVMSGYNGTVFAYGQTGTGKTFTMDGIADPPELRGVMPRSFEHVFSEIENSQNDIQYLVTASFLEIYKDDVFDLLAVVKRGEKQTKLDVKEDIDKGIYVKDLQQFEVRNVEEINSYLDQGKLNRKVGSTSMNKDSSRSHCIFTIMIETSQPGPDGQHHIKAGKLNLVDLAGSEKVSKTGASGDRAKEGIEINLSLSALGNVIGALVNPKSQHIPYRDSKLTRLLQDSLGGNTKTVMIANIGPADYNLEETVNTLRFASRAKKIQNKPHVNEDPKDAKLRDMQDEISRLKKALADAEANGGQLDLSSFGSTLGGVLGGGSNGGLGPLARLPQKIIVNKVVEKVVKTGVSQEKVKELEEAGERERKMLEEKHQKEKQEILAIKKQMEEKRENIEAELKEQDSAFHNKRNERVVLSAKLKDIESKLVQGNRIIDEAKKQAVMIEKNKAELARQKLEKERLEQEVRQREEMQLSLAEKYETLDKELAAKTAKLQKFMSKYNEIKQEISDVQAENQKEREELLETIRELTRHLQLKDVILDNFVPREENERIAQRAFWDEQGDEWKLAAADLAAMNRGFGKPASVKPNVKRPTTDFARLRFHNGPRYRDTNIIDLDFDMPERTTQDFPDFQNQLYEANANSQAQASMNNQDPYQQQQYDRPATARRQDRPRY